MSQNICLSFDSEAHYQSLVDDPMLFRDFLARADTLHPALFPTAWSAGFTLHDAYQSKKTAHFIRRVKVTETEAVVSIRPSFLMPYHTARTDEVEKLFIYDSSVSHWPLWSMSSGAMKSIGIGSFCNWDALH